MHWSLRVEYFLGAHSALYDLSREPLSPVVRRSRLDAFTNEDRNVALPAGAAEGPSYDLDITRRLLQRLHVETQADGALLLVVNAISTSDLATDIPENVELLAWCEEAGLACVDTYEDFRLERERQSEQERFLPDRHHWNAAGHVVVSARIRDTLRNPGWIGGTERARSLPGRRVLARGGSLDEDRSGARVCIGSAPEGRVKWRRRPEAAREDGVEEAT